MVYYRIEDIKNLDDYDVFEFENEREAKLQLSNIIKAIEDNDLSYRIRKISKERYQFTIDSMMKPMYN